jgi:hypothetical protein
MFSTCLFCHGALGANDAIEHFPVGKRLVFDGERGRLWAVCLHCHQWNLAPIEERWEALEECETRYRDVTQRVSTDNIALARLKDGTDLVRIGQPLLPEFAAWRYGGHYIERYRRHLRNTFAFQAVGISLIGSQLLFRGALPISAYFGISVALTGVQWLQLATVARQRMLPRRIVRTATLGPRAVTYSDAKGARVRLGDDGSVRIGLLSRPVVRASEAMARLGVGHLWLGSGRVESWHDTSELTTLLPQLLGASHLQPSFHRDEINNAVDVMVEHVHHTVEPADLAAVRMLTDFKHGIGRPEQFPNGRALDSIPAPVRLAAEMALHEDDERRALAGELGALYARWEEAERIARIADGELTRLPARG